MTWGLPSPRHYREFAAPYAERVAEEVHRLGVDLIFHVCGDTGNILDCIAEARPAAFGLGGFVAATGCDIALGSPRGNRGTDARPDASLRVYRAAVPGRRYIQNSLPRRCRASGIGGPRVDLLDDADQGGRDD